MKKVNSRVESISDEAMFSAITTEESQEVTGGGVHCVLTTTCTFGPRGDTLTVSDTIVF